MAFFGLRILLTRFGRCTTLTRNICVLENSFFTYFEDDLDKVLTLFVLLLHRWYEDNSIAFKVCTSLLLSPCCVANNALLFKKKIRLLFGSRILVWLLFMLSGFIMMEKALLSQNSTRAWVTGLQPLSQTR